LSARELLEAQLARMETCHPALNAVGRRWHEMALLDVTEQPAALTPGDQRPLQFASDA